LRLIWDIISLMPTCRCILQIIMTDNWPTKRNLLCGKVDYQNYLLRITNVAPALLWRRK
jgi:hypothetical protein